MNVTVYKTEQIINNIVAYYISKQWLNIVFSLTHIIFLHLPPPKNINFLNALKIVNS